MARKKLEKRNIRKIARSGAGSYRITIPVDVVRLFRWKERQKVVLKADTKRKRITIEDWKE